VPLLTESLLRTWGRLQTLPGGSWLFSRFLGVMVPYTGTIGAHVRELRPGYARITLRDRRHVRQHLGSVHAVALINLGEVTSGLAMLTALPPGVRSIVTNLTAEYAKKARGTLTSEARVTVPEVTGPVEHTVMAEIRDAGGDVVCRVRVVWRLEARSEGRGARRGGEAALLAPPSSRLPNA
jgi:acyl-coenzyme A thioesterase PaaI-like protein